MRFVTILYIVVFVLISSACDFHTISGDNNVKIQQRKVGSFRAINVKGAYELLLKQDSVCRVQIEADSNLFDVISTSIINNVLYIKSSKTIIKSEKLKIVIFVDSLDKIDVSGAIELNCDSALNFRNLMLDVSGAAQVNLNLNTHKFVSNISGGSEMVLIGKSQQFNITLTGAGRIHAFDLDADTCEVNLSGLGRIDLSARTKLDVNISGAGKVEYKGNAKVYQTITGAGSVEKVF